MNIPLGPRVVIQSGSAPHASRLLGVFFSAFIIFLGASGCRLTLRTAETPKAAPVWQPIVKGGQGPVLDVGPEGTWDSGHVHAPSVIKAGQVYMMWYDGNKDGDLYKGWGIGLATSSNGVEWIKDGRNPLLSPGSPGAWDSVSLHDPRVTYEGRGYMMWYSGYDGDKWQIGYAFSPDGITWTKHPQNPVLSPGPPGSWDEAAVAYSSVVKKGRVYLMWYQGQDAQGVWRIGHATSEDGIKWAKSGRNPVLGPGPPPSWDGERVFTPHVVPWGEDFLMLYTGGPRWGIGYALSKDGLDWKKGPENPLITTGSPNQWDGAQVITLSALAERDLIRLWYAGSDGKKLRIGLATAPIKKGGQGDTP